jgi:hypothetical protein
MRSFALGLVVVLLAAVPAGAETTGSSTSLFAPRAAHDPWRVDWGVPPNADAAAVVAPGPLRLEFPTVPARQTAGQPLHAAAIEHSDAYRLRAKIHRYASFATLPLFAAQVALGQSLYDTPANAGGKRAAHAVVGAGIVGLFAVNTVTGAWNLFGEGRRDKEGRTLRWVHGLLMMAADIGMLATTASGPSSENEHHALTFEVDKRTHRNMAVASIGIGTAGYLVMLFGNH